MTERAERLRERVAKEIHKAVNEIAVEPKWDWMDDLAEAEREFLREYAAHVLRAVVEELGLRKRMAYHEETHAIHTLLEASGAER